MIETEVPELDAELLYEACSDCWERDPILEGGCTRCWDSQLVPHDCTEG